MRALTVSVIAAAVTLLQACGGGTPNYQAPTTINPISGVTLQAIQITPPIPFLQLGGTRQLFATGVYSDGTSHDITSDVTWIASSAPSTTSNVSISSGGIATGVSIGPSQIMATVGGIDGVLTLIATTNGYASNTTGILTVPLNASVPTSSYKQAIDVAYVPQSQNKIQDVYTVQEVNLDADAISNVLPLPFSVLATIPMPAGFVPNATAASQTSDLVAVISYTSPYVQVIDASNFSSDTSNNTIVSTFKSPVTKSVTFDGVTCMICAAVVNPANNQLLLSTANGYYSMDLVAGTFTALPLEPAPQPAPSITLSPVGTSSYAFGPTFGSTGAELQVFDLGTNAVTNITTLGLTQPNALALDVSTNYAVVSDAGANYQALLDLQNPVTPVLSQPVSDLGVCTGQTGGFNMAAVGVGANSSTTSIPHTLLLSKTGGSCVGFEFWPSVRGDSSVFPGSLLYGFGGIPAGPDGKPFIVGSDPNSIATFTSVVDKKNYGILINTNQNWVAKFNLPGIAGQLQPSFVIPAGFDISTSIIPPGADVGQFGGYTVVYLPTPASVVTLSAATINFGTQPAGASTAPIAVNLTNTSTSVTTSLSISKIAITGANSGDFSEIDNCVAGVGVLTAGTRCTINITFTPSGTGARTASLSVTDNGGQSPQVVTLSGTGS